MNLRQKKKIQGLRKEGQIKRDKSAKKRQANNKAKKIRR